MLVLEYLPLVAATLVRRVVVVSARAGIHRRDKHEARREIERSRRAVWARCLQDWNSTTDVAESYMDFAFSGMDMLAYPDAIRAVTREDLLERIRLSYHPSRLVLSVVKPKKEK